MIEYPNYHKQGSGLGTTSLRNSLDSSQQSRELTQLEQDFIQDYLFRKPKRKIYPPSNSHKSKDLRNSIS
jgi:hypothetical protein